MTDSTPYFAHRYTEISGWQYHRGLALLEVARPSDGDVALDLGCGTGNLSIELARRVGPSGRVLALDPDRARLDEAIATAPKSATNLSFEIGAAEHLTMVADRSLDLIFSNYAVHWVLDHETMFDEVARVLKPGGRFVSECVGATPEFFVELLMLMPDGAALKEENRFNSETEWRSMIGKRALDIETLEWQQHVLAFPSIDSLYDWLEGTSHGGFQADLMDAKDRRRLSERFPDEAPCDLKALRIVLLRQA